MEKGGAVDVCAIYLPNRKLSQVDLIDGVGAANPSVMVAEMLREDTRLAMF